MLSSTRRVHSRAFTLIELLVVIAIIAILAAILFPVFAQAKRAAKVAVDISNTKQLALGITMYSADTDDVWPMTTQGLAISCGGPWVGPPRWWVGIQQMTYPYVKNTDIYWSSLDPKPGSLKTPLVPDPVFGVTPDQWSGKNLITGTWGDWSKEETIMPNNVALNVWDGACGTIKPRSITSVEFPADLGIFIPVVGPIAGLATNSTNPTDAMIDLDPWFNSCIGNFSNPTPNGNGHGWTPVYAALVAHGTSLPVAFGDGHAKSIKQDKFHQEGNATDCNQIDSGNTSSNQGFYEGANASKFWGFYLQNWPIIN